MTDEFQSFVEARYPALLRTAYLLTGSREVAEDLLQSVLLKVMPRWRRMDHPEAYLRKAMVNHLISRARRRRVVEVLIAVLPERSSPDPQIEVRDELWRALHELPPQMRAVLVLRYWEDLSETDTAAALGCSVGTVKSQSSRGLHRLRDLMTASARASQPSIATGEPT